jgi:hypothetical protein
MDPKKRHRSRSPHLTQKELGMIACADPKVVAMQAVRGAKEDEVTRKMGGVMPKPSYPSLPPAAHLPP